MDSFFPQNKEILRGSKLNLKNNQNKVIFIYLGRRGVQRSGQLRGLGSVSTIESQGLSCDCHVWW